MSVAAYLRDLGVSHIYASPLLRSSAGSSHGYDVCDFKQLNPELGTEEDLGNLAASLKAVGMGIVLDLVPNHMGIAGSENAIWNDVLESGQASAYADYFDIDWDDDDSRHRGKVVLPILGDRYHGVLYCREFRVERDGADLCLRYGDHRMPVRRRTLGAIAGSAARTKNNRQWLDLSRWFSSADETTNAASPDGFTVSEGAFDSFVEWLNGEPDAMDALIRAQNYVPIFWKNGNDQINYRRFFAISTLAALRVEHPSVFVSSHARIRAWLERGWFDGLRVDHPDGLRDPEGYLRRLRDIAPRAWIVVEKILQPGENLPLAWPVAGSTGYDFANLVLGLFIDPKSESQFAEAYAAFTGQKHPYESVLHEKKRLVLQTLFRAEVDRLVRTLIRIAAGRPVLLDFTRDELTEAVVELAAHFPVYRTYVRPEDAIMGDDDLSAIRLAVKMAKTSRPEIDERLFGAFEDLLTLRLTGQLEPDFVARFQQLTGPAMAKGGEDTAFYCYNRFAALNEVGGNPARFGIDTAEFLLALTRCQRHWPDRMLATATHDTKRGEDVRARLCVLSEMPYAWAEAVRKWSDLNRDCRKDGWADPNMEYLYYQTLVGAWPISVERAAQYMDKASREACEQTSWSEPSAQYDDGLRAFVENSFGNKAFIDELERFVAVIRDAGYVNSLGQTLLKLTAPGAPDIYQGAELWDFSLVDPDNRRPVDFEARRRLLAEVKPLTGPEVWARRPSGAPKLWVIWKTLGLRVSRPGDFQGSSSIVPTPARGTKASHVVSFIRNGRIVVAVPRLVVGLNSEWRDTVLELPAGTWRNIFAPEATVGGDADLAGLLGDFPVALLCKED
jgi:(1->4)-alpha-D-glucan 1-alpha-D-glucosylmutase